MSLDTQVGARRSSAHPSTSACPEPIITATADKPHVVVVTRHVVLQNRVVTHRCGVCRGDSLSLYYKCDLCAEQLAGNTYAKRMMSMSSAAERFWERHMGQPYVEFKGGAA
jgi:hypothetical protein